MSDALAFGPAPKPRFGFFKKHRIVTWCIAFTMTVTSAAFAAWVISNILTTTQNSKARVGSASVLTNITTTLPTDQEVAGSGAGICPAPNPATPPVINCELTLKIQNDSGVNVTLTELRWNMNGNATVTHSDDVCAGTFASVENLGTQNFLVGGHWQGPGTTIITYDVDIPVPQGLSFVNVPNAFGVNPNGVDGNACANSAVSFENALHTVMFMAAP